MMIMFISGTVKDCCTAVAHPFLSESVPEHIPGCVFPFTLLDIEGCVSHDCGMYHISLSRSGYRGVEMSTGSVPRKRKRDQKMNTLNKLH